MHIFDHTSAAPKDRLFRLGIFAILFFTALYTALVLSAWGKTPLGLVPQGESAAWLNSAEALFQGNLPREPFFRAPAYLATLAMMRELGVPVSHLATAARALNAVAHVLTTALVIWLAFTLWKRRGALLAGVLWGFYPPAIFLAAQPGPETLAILLWVTGLTAALGTLWNSPLWAGGRVDYRHLWAYPFVAGVAFVLAAALCASLWVTALAWPLLVLLLGRDFRGSRFLAASLGFGVVILGMTGLQIIWGGSPQPLAGADLYRLNQALDILAPWAAPIPAVQLRADFPTPDFLETEAFINYQVKTGRPIPGLSVLGGFWWRQAVEGVKLWPLHSALRAARKAFQFFQSANEGIGPDFARAQSEIWLLRINFLGWVLLLVGGVAGAALAWRAPGAALAVFLAALAGLGGILWYPTMESRTAVAIVLAIFSGSLVAQPWPRAWGRNLLVFSLALGCLALAYWPRPSDTEELLSANDTRQRALAWVALGDYDHALSELSDTSGSQQLSFFDREMAAGWRFTRMLKSLPTLPSREALEQELLENADLAEQSHEAQFHSAVCLWLLDRQDGALYFWENLANRQDGWGAAARAALAASGHESPEEARRRQAWEIGGGPQPDPDSAAFLKWLRTTRPQ